MRNGFTKVTKHKQLSVRRPWVLTFDLTPDPSPDTSLSVGVVSQPRGDEMLKETDSLRANQQWIEFETLL